jgi:hypothetical protein
MTQVQKYYKSKYTSHLYVLNTYVQGYTRSLLTFFNGNRVSLCDIHIYIYIYTKDDFIIVLFYVNSSFFRIYTNDTLVLYDDFKMCPPHMHTNEVLRFFFYCLTRLSHFQRRTCRKKTTTTAATTIIDQSVYRMTAYLVIC